MSDTRNGLPADWQVQRLEKIASLITSGGTPTSGSPRYYLEYGGLPFAKTEDLTRAGSRFIEACELGISEVALKETAAKKYPAGTVLISMYGTIGLTKITAIEMAANQALCALIPPLACDSGYLYHHLEYTRSEWLKYSGQTTQANINGATVRAHEVPLPDPREQRKISEILDTLDTAIHETEAIIAKLKAVKQGLLHDLLTRGIAANGELRPPQTEAPHLYKLSPLGWIPKEWEVAPLGELSASLVDGPFGSNLKTAHYVENPGVRVVRLQNILAGEYDDSERAFISERHAVSLARNRVTAGDALIASLGDASYPVGRSCCYPADLPDAINKADCFRFRSGSRCRNEFVMLSMNGTAARKQVSGYEQGVTMKRINLGNLRRVEIALPSVPEQEMIAVRFGTIQKQIDFTSLELEKLQFEKSGLMDDLLTGRVRVTSLLEPAAP